MTKLETWPELKARHRREEVGLVRHYIDSRHTLSTAAVELGIKVNALHGICVRRGVRFVSLYKKAEIDIDKFHENMGLVVDVILLRTGVDGASLRGKGMARRYVDARRDAYKIAHSLGYSYQHIGEYFKRSRDSVKDSIELHERKSK